MKSVMIADQKLMHTMNVKLTLFEGITKGLMEVEYHNMENETHTEGNVILTPGSLVVFPTHLAATSLIPDYQRLIKTSCNLCSCFHTIMYSFHVLTFFSSTSSTFLIHFSLIHILTFRSQHSPFTILLFFFLLFGAFDP